ncbi:hypothetical protein ACWKSP_31675 [Micromonosporaceae bacterium Da 78-11]
MTTTQLDRRRQQSATAETAAEKARKALTELDQRLHTNVELTRQQTQALRNAEAEARRLKRSLKTQSRDQARLTKARQKAAAKVDKTRSRAAALDEKYSKSLLADLIRREKEKDRAAAQPATPTTDASLTESSSLPADKSATPADSAAPPADDATTPVGSTTSPAEQGLTAPESATIIEAADDEQAPSTSGRASTSRSAPARNTARATAARSTATKAAGAAFNPGARSTTTRKATAAPDPAKETAARKTTRR